MARFPEIDAVTGILREAARTIIMPRHRNLGDGDIDAKGSGEIVTIVDLQCEDFLARRLGDLLPGAAIVGEEGTAGNPALLTHIADEDWVWIVDPLDGTANFAAGAGPFVVIVALVASGATVAGWILDPVADILGVAEAGSGAQINGRAATVSKAEQLSEMTGLFGEKLFPPGYGAALAALAGALGEHRNLRCIGREYLDLASAAADLAATGRLYPWDHAAGALLHREAGGVQALVDGRAYAPTVAEGIMVTAPNREAWEAAREILMAGK